MQSLDRVRPPGTAFPQEMAMKRIEWALVWGIVLVMGGLLFLLQNLGILGPSATLLWAFLFLAAGAVFLYVFITSPARWWPIIPGLGLVSLAGLMALEELSPAAAEIWGGSIFLGGLAVSFWVVYFLDRKSWWAVIPGGVLFTLAVVAYLGSAVGGMESGGVFFLGLGLTFGLLRFLPTGEGRQKWALIPAAVCLVLALLVLAQAATILQYLWPVALIAGGLYLVLRYTMLRRRE
jgi:hypothetical protein